MDKIKQIETDLSGPVAAQPYQQVAIVVISFHILASFNYGDSEGTLKAAA